MSLRLTREAAVARQQCDAHRRLREGQAEEFLAFLQAQAGLAPERDVVADQEQDRAAGLARAADIEFEVAHAVRVAIDGDHHAILRYPGGQRRRHAFGQLGRRDQRFQQRTRVDGFVGDAEHGQHGRVHGTDMATVVDHDQAGRHPADDLLQVILVLDHAALVRVRIGVERESDVQADDLEDAVAGGAEMLRFGMHLFPHQLDQLGQVFAIRPDIPFRLQADALVDQSDAQPFADIVLAVLARSQAAKVGHLRALQALHCPAVAHQGAQGRKTQHVVVEAVRQGIDLLVDQAVQLAQQRMVVLVQLQKGHACSELLLIEADFMCDRLDRLIERPGHGWHD